MKTSTAQQTKSLIFEHLGEMAQALASPVRLRIIQHLTNRSSHVEELSHFTGYPLGTVSQHLQKLRQAGLVKIEKQGTSRLYSLANKKVVEVWVGLQELASVVDPFVREKEEEIAPLEICARESVAEILEQVENKRAILIDVRDEADTDSTPVNGALHIPCEKVLSRLQELPKSKTIYLFCRGRYCELATNAVHLLRKKGFKAFRLKENSIQIGQYTHQ